MAFLRLYVGDIKNLLTDRVTSIPLNVHSVRIMESVSFADGYTNIDDIPINKTTEYVETGRADSDNANRWYKLRYISNPSVNPITVFAETEPLLPESLSNCVETLRQWMGDYDSGKDDWIPAWTDLEYMQSIRFALKQHKGTTNLSQISEEDWLPLQLLVRSHFSNIIAYDHAKYYRLQVATASMDKSEIQRNYQSYAQEADRAYAQISNRLNLDSGGYGTDGVINQMPAPNVTEITRLSRTTGLHVQSSRPTYIGRRRSNRFRPENPYL